MDALSPSEFRNFAHQVADLSADYLEQAKAYPVVSRATPGQVRLSLPAHPPQQAEGMDQILEDYKTLIEPHLTHWNHPGFMAYFSITGSAPGILAESLTAALNVNAMLWKTSPAATELEELCCDWLRQMLGLPSEFSGHLNDTASISTFLALAAARHQAPGLDIRNQGLSSAPPLIVYASEHAHSSIDKAVLALGLGLNHLRKIPADAQFSMQPEALRQAIAQDRAKGCIPIAVVATIGTTSSASVDPVASIAQICLQEKLWLHVDAAYAGSAMVCPELRPLAEGWEKADSIVMNPHKWLFVPIDCSVLFVRSASALKDAFSLMPEYLKTSESGVTNLMDYGIQLGRRFRALKLWMVIRSFGVQGLASRIRHHCRLAQEFALWLQADGHFEVCAPVLFSLVCFRLRGTDAQNEQLLARINAEGPYFLSHTKLNGRFVLRMAIGNVNTEREHLQALTQLLLLARP